MIKSYPTAYYPTIGLMAQLITEPKIAIEAHENYIKQTFRNRTSILQAHGVMHLIIPVQKNSKLISEIQISYQEKWQHQHWGAIVSAYKNAPYFEYYAPYFEQFYKQETNLLLEFNLQILKACFKVIKADVEIIQSSYYQEFGNFSLPNEFKFTTYQQVFQSNTILIQDLSILDLIFNLGPETFFYLKQNSKILCNV